VAVNLPPYPLGTDLCGVNPCSKSVLLDAGHFNDFWPQIYPPSYLDALISPGPGYEILQADAVLFARVSLAAARVDCGSHILDSFGGALSNGYVEFRRISAASGDTTIRAGSVVSTSKGGRNYLTLADAVFAGGALGPVSVQVAAVQPGFEYNVTGARLTATGVVLPGDVDTVTKLDAFLSPSGDRFFGSPAFTVTNPLDICGGRPPMLDGLGDDRGIARSNSEADADYKNRIRALPETVTPNALRAAINAAFALYGYSIGAGIDFIETWSPDYQTCYDAVGTNIFCFDDPRDINIFRNRWYGEEDFRGALIVVVPVLGAISDVGMAFDDTAAGPMAISPDTGGLRALSAFDVLTTTPIQQGGYDGFDLAKQGVYMGLYDLLDRIKAGGVFFAIELRGE
jgi:hypothetical protein